MDVIRLFVYKCRCMEAELRVVRQGRRQERLVLISLDNGTRITVSMQDVPIIAATLDAIMRDEEGE